MSKKRGFKQKLLRRPAKVFKNSVAGDRMLARAQKLRKTGMPAEAAALTAFFEFGTKHDLADPRHKEVLDVITAWLIAVGELDPEEISNG